MTHRCRRVRSLTGCALALVTALAACGGDGGGPTGPGGSSGLLAWHFDRDLEGWDGGTADSESWGSVQWQIWDDDDPSGWVKLDGTGDAAQPNSWISRSVDLPPDAATLRFRTAPHNRPGGDAALRVRLLDGAADQVLLDWDVIAHTGEDGGDLIWHDRSVSVAAYAGRTVTLYFEQNDNGPGSHEQRYIDDIVVTR